MVADGVRSYNETPVYGAALTRSGGRGDRSVQDETTLSAGTICSLSFWSGVRSQAWAVADPSTEISRRSGLRPR